MSDTTILDIPFINKTKDQILHENIIKAATNKEKLFIVTANPEIVVETTRDNEYKKILQDADLVVADGIGIIKAAKILGTPLKERVAGIELFTDMLRYANTEQKSCYFLGGSQKVNDKLRKVIKEKYPDLIIAGGHHGYIKLSDEEHAEEIVKRSPDFIFVALGYPKQEKWIDLYKEDFSYGVFMGVGGSFDVLSGEVERAPEKWINANLEWLYRIVKQPKRILRLSNVFIFLKLVYQSKLKRKK